MHCKTTVIGPRYTGNKTIQLLIQLLPIIATTYNAAMQPVDDMQQHAIIGSNIVLEPAQEKVTFTKSLIC